jgi:hypothetical protein
MNFKSKLVSVFGAGIIALSMVGGVAAQETHSDQADVRVAVNMPEGGTLTYWIADSGAGFTPVMSTFNEDGESTGTLILSVEDTRFNREGWALGISTSGFTGQTTQDVIEADHLEIVPGSVDTVAGDNGDHFVKPAQIVMDSETQGILSAPEGSGSGQYTLPLNATVTIPANTEADTYVATVIVTETAHP